MDPYALVAAFSLGMTFGALLTSLINSLIKPTKKTH